MSINRRGGMRFLAPGIYFALLLSGQATRADAQHLPDRTFAVPSQASETGPEAWAVERPRAWPYVLTGAVLGAAALGVGLALTWDRSTEAVMSPFSLAPAFAGCAAVGGGIGYLVYRIRL